MVNNLVARQPIHESNLELRAYALLSETPGDSTSGAGEEAYNRGGFWGLSDSGLDKIVGTHPAFVEVSQRALLEGAWKSLPRDRVVLGVPSALTPDPDIRKSLREVSAMGYRTAVSAVQGTQVDGRTTGADFIRVDVADLEGLELAREVARLSEPNVLLVAENVDTYEKFELCKDHGFDLYRGGFYCTPRSDVPDIPGNRLATLRLLNKLQDPDIPLDQLEDTIRIDVALSYKLIRFANSAYIGLNKPVESIQHATSMVGLDRIRLWASLLMLAKMEEKPRELMITAVVRAAMCERLVTAVGGAPRETAFTTGLFSVLPALMDCSMERALEALPLSDQIQGALISFDGCLGEALKCVLAYEQGNWNDVNFRELESATIRDHYLDSVDWSRRMSEGLNI